MVTKTVDVNLQLRKGGKKAKCQFCGYSIEAEQERVRLTVNSTKRRFHLECSIEFCNFMIRLPQMKFIRPTVPPAEGVH